MRNPVETRKQILNVAFMEVYEHGFQAVSVNDIIKKTTVTKGAFFHHFPTKNDLGYAIVDEVLAGLTITKWVQPLTAYKNPIQGILKNLKEKIDESTDEQLGLGCPLNNLVQEMSTVDPVFREKLNAVLEIWIQGVEKHLKRAQEGGYLSSEADTRQMAEFVVATHEGGFGMSKSFKNRRVFLSIYGSLKDYLLSVE
jgi:TetR/AcrR family transcriptional regulator, transcriptional repressor for nem operon